MPQNPTRQVHALLGNLPTRTLAEKRRHRQHDKILHATLIFTRTKKLWLTKRLLKKDFAKHTETQILENLILQKNDNANEANKILQTQLTRTFAEKRQADFRNFARRKNDFAKRNRLDQSKPKLDKNAGEGKQANFENL